MPARASTSAAAQQEHDTSDMEKQDMDSTDDEVKDLDNVSMRDQDEQTPGERRAIRSNLRTMIDNIKENQHDYVDPKSDLLTNTLGEANDIFGRVKTTREAALDSQLVALIALRARQMSQQLHTGFVVFNPANFVMKVAATIGEVTHHAMEEDAVPSMSLEDWAEFGKKHQHHFKTSPTLNFLFGTFARDPVPVRRPRLPRQKEKEKEANAQTVPKQLKSLKEASTEEATTTEVEKILSILWRVTSENDGVVPVCYFSFVINPNSFSQTVENIFYTSFLVKDGHAKITLDRDRLPRIEPMERPKEGAERADNRPKTQVVMPLTVTQWRELVEVFNITESTIPDRPRHATAGALKRKVDSS